MAKVGTILTTRNISTQSTTTKTRTTASSEKTAGKCCRTVPADHIIKIFGVNYASLYRDLTKQSLAKI